MNKQKISEIVRIILIAALALAVVFGYDVGVIQPRESSEVGWLPAVATGDTNFTNVVADGDVTVGDDLVVGDAATVTGVLTTVAGADVGTDLTASTVAVGGGFGATGCSVSAVGALQCDGAATFGSTVAVTSTLTVVGAVYGADFVTSLYIDDIAASQAITTDVAGLQMPFAATLNEVSLWARGVTGTVECDVYETGGSVLASSATLSAGVPVIATVSDASLADNAEITVGCATGVGEAVTDLTVMLTLKR